MRLREDPTLSGALRLALSDDARELPEAESILELAEVLELRLRDAEPTRLSASVGTPPLLRQALRADTVPDPRALGDVWERVRRAGRGEPSAASLRLNRRAVLPGEERPNVAPTERPYRVAHGRRIALVAAGAVTVSTLAAAGVSLVRDVPDGAAEPGPAPPAAMSADAPPARRATPHPSRAHDVVERAPPDPRNLPVSEVAAASSESLRAAAATRSARSAGEASASDHAEARSAFAEANLLRDAWAALRAGRPALALAFARDHAARYPSGALAQEREVVLIEALARLGRAEEARARAARFEEAFPDSPHKPLANGEALPE